MSIIRRSWVFALLLVVLLVAGCAQAQPTAQPTAAAPVEVPATAPASEAYPVEDPAAEPMPTATPEAYALPEPELAPTEAPAAALTNQVSIFLVALEDKGQSGKQIGCDDSIVAVERPIEPTAEPLRAALEQLLSLREREYGQSGLYNALYQSELTLDSVSVQDGKATVTLSGKMQLGGVCDNPRFEAQIQETVLQFPEVQEVAVTVNGTPLEELLSMQ